VAPLSPNAVSTVNIYPGGVTTVAGDGLSHTVNGNGEAAGFKAMGGVVVVGNYAYVATAGSIRKVDLTPGPTYGDVSILAGDAIAIACVASNDPTLVRFGSSPGGIDSDGTYLYMADSDCGKIWRTAIVGGATSIASSLGGATGYNSVTYAPNGYLYTVGGASILKVNPVDGTTITYATIAAYAITSDPTYLWATYKFSCHTPCYTKLRRYELLTGGIQDFEAPNAGSMTGDYQLVSAGDFLYAENYGDTIVERITKTDGTVVNVAGTGAAGYQDPGTGTDAWFSKVTGLGSDGTNLWAADSGNFRLREIVSDSALPSSLSPNTTTTFDIYPGKVTTFAGDGTNHTADGIGAAAGFKDMGGAVVVGNYAYVFTAGSIRKVDLSGPIPGDVTTLAGDATAIACTPSNDHNAVRFGSDPGGIDSDGYYLYAVDPTCSNNIWRISIATGATSIVAALPTGYKSITYAPNGYLYAAGGDSILRVDPVNGTTSTYAPISAYAITSDETYLWATYRYFCKTPCYTKLDRIQLDNGAVTTFQVPNGGSMTGDYQLVSAGQYLYAEYYGEFTLNDTGVERITKVNGAVGILAGGSSGQAEGEWSNAKFSKVTGLAFDGESLWIADSGNHLFSKAVFVPLLAQEMGVGASSDASAPHAVVGDPVDTAPASGAFMWSATDATLPVAGVMPFAFGRSYSSRSADIGNSAIAGSLGIGWRGSFDATVEIQAAGDARVTMPNGQALTFTWNGTAFTRAAGVYDSLAATPGNTYTLTRLDGTAYKFEESIYSGWMWRLLSITDLDGNQQTVTYNSDQSIQQVSLGGRIMSFTYTYDPTTVTLSLPDGPNPRTVVYSLNGDRQLESVKDLNGNIWTYTYQGSQLSMIKDPYNSPVVTNVYGSDRRIASQQDGDLPPSLYDYSTCNSNCTKVTDGRGHISVYQYSPAPDGRGILTQVLDQNQNTTIFANPDTNYNPQTVTDPRNNNWAYTYDSITGNVLSKTSPGASGNASYLYDPTFNKVTQVTDARGKVTRYVYDVFGNLQCEILPTAPAGSSTCAADLKQKISYTEYSNGQVHTVITPPNDGTSTQGGMTTYTYYADGTVKDVTRPGPAAGTTTFTTYSDISYDSVCQCQTMTMVTPQGNANNCGTSCAAYTWTYKYDNIGHLTRVTDPLGHATSYAFDLAGRMQSSTDARLKTTTFTYVPGTGRLQSVSAPSGIGGSAVTTYFYDEDGNVACEILPTATIRTSCTSDTAHTVSHTYTNNNRLASTTDPDQHAWSYDYTNWVSLGKVTESLPGGGTIARSYDGDNRPTLVNYSDTTPDVSYSYSSWVSLGKVSMSDGAPGGSLVYSYDALNELTGVKRGTAAGFSYLYFPDGSIRTRTYPDTNATTYAYRPDGSLWTVTNGGQVTTYTYTVGTATATESMPNGVLTISILDQAGRLTSLTNMKGTNTLSSFAVTPDEVGNPATVVASIKNASMGGTLKTETQTYTYDDAERLTQVCYLPGCSGAGLAGYSWTYDAAGNRLTQQAKGTPLVTTYYFYDGANHLCWSGPTNGSSCGTVPSGDTGYTYNFRGDQTSAGSVAYSYDLADRLTSVVNGSTTDTYTYDGAGNRLTNVRGATTTTFAWDVNASVPLLATDSDSSARDYIYGNGLISEKVGSARYYYSSDAFGSVANETTSNGSLARSYWYDPWGGQRTETSSATGAPINYLQFDGEYHDNTGAYNLRARIYQPGLGSFQQSDPAGVSSYAFASGRPTVMSDPSGMLSIWGWIGIGIVVAAVAGVVTCAAITVGICAGFTIFGLGATATAAGTGAVACEEGVCNEAGQLLNEAEQVLSTGSAAEAGSGWFGVTNATANRAGTLVPRSFDLSVAGQDFAVLPNATKHIAEYATSTGAGSMPFSSLAGALETAVDRGMLGAGRNFLTIGNWELGIDMTKNVIYHAVYRP
jgi:RHS repeat-associated protein